MYKILDKNNNVVVAVTEDKHEADRAWDVLTLGDKELEQVYRGQTEYLEKLIAKYRKPFEGPLEFVQVHRTFEQKVEKVETQAEIKKDEADTSKPIQD